MNPNGSIEATTSTLCLMEYYEQENYREMLHTDTHEREGKTGRTATQTQNVGKKGILSLFYEIKLH